MPDTNAHSQIRTLFRRLLADLLPGARLRRVETMLRQLGRRTELHDNRNQARANITMTAIYDAVGRDVNQRPNPLITEMLERYALLEVTLWEHLNDLPAEVASVLLTEFGDQAKADTTPVDEDRRDLGRLPAELVAMVRKTWDELHEKLPDDMSNAEYWATMASQHDEMATAYSRLFDALNERGLLAILAMDARSYHLNQACSARSQHRREQAALDTTADVEGLADSVGVLNRDGVQQ